MAEILKKKLSQKDESPYKFTIKYELERTSVKDQNKSKSGACWAFSTVSFLESEILRMYGKETNLSEMFIVRNAFPDKAESYMRLQGNTLFYRGGLAHDVMDIINNYGLVPESAFTEIHAYQEEYYHYKLEKELKVLMDSMLSSNKVKLSECEEEVEQVLNKYLGNTPSTFIFEHKEYTPKTFVSDYLKINTEDYWEFTSFSHHAFYEKFRLEIAGNWSYDEDYYNIPLDELESMVDDAIQNGYSVVWDGDVSEPIISTVKTGYGVIPDDSYNQDYKGVVKEKEITQKLRQEAFDNLTTTDDHLMHIVGIAYDQNGTKFYLCKNSSGINRKFDGYMYLSRSYFRYKTISVMLNQNGISKKLKKKLKL